MGVRKKRRKQERKKRRIEEREEIIFEGNIKQKIGKNEERRNEGRIYTHTEISWWMPFKTN